ncbi:MAG: glycosyltransferase family 4 protein, partial [Candidatus Thermoplasmatota archaeon]|nr:glycosyltransferase family 4 protein [Candidatus Thermoplasmatota archaeon]
QKNINLFNPDVIIGLGLLNVHIARLKAKKNRIPFVFYSIDKNYSLVPSSLYKPFAKFLEKLNVLNADLVLTINKGLRNFALDLGCKQKNVKIITGGVDIESYCYKGNRKTIRKKYGYTEKDTVLFFMGWIYEFSGMKEVVLELAKYKDRNPNIKLLLVGEGDLFNELQLIRERYNLHDSVNLTGKQPFEKIPEFLAMSDICLLPAYYNDIMRDIVPIKVYEYMAASKPVIATRLPGIMEEFGKNHGIVYINKSEETLQKSLEMINRGIVKDEGIKARKFVEEYDWTKITNDFEKVLEELG